MMSYLVSAAAIVSILATSSSAIFLLQDDFDDGDAAGWQEFDGSFSASTGVYNITSSAVCNDARSANGDVSWTDYNVDVDFNIPNGHAAILFRVETIASGCDAGRYYQFAVFPSSVSFCRMNFSGGSCTILASASFTTSTSAWHHARITVSGTTASASIDGVPALSFGGFTDYPAGRIGLKRINSGTASYDNVVVTTSEPCPPSPLASCETGWLKGALAISEGTAGKERLKAKLTKGPALAQVDYGNPLNIGGTDYALCIYDDAAQLRGSLPVVGAGNTCGTSPCWRPVGGIPPAGKGYSYRDQSRASSGVSKIKLIGRPTGSGITVGAGNNSSRMQTSMPTGIPGALLTTTMVTMQIHPSDGGSCFARTLSDISTQTSTTFIAK